MADSHTRSLDCGFLISKQKAAVAQQIYVKQSKNNNRRRWRWRWQQKQPVEMQINYTYLLCEATTQEGQQHKKSNNHRNTPIQNKRSRRQIAKQQEWNKTTLRELTILTTLLPNSLSLSLLLSFSLSHFDSLTRSRSLVSHTLSLFWLLCVALSLPLLPIFFHRCVLFTLAIFTAHK